MTYPPYFWNERDEEKISTQMKPIYTESELEKFVVTGLLNSSLFYWWFIILSDCRHLNIREIDTFGIDLDKIPREEQLRIAEKVKELMNDLEIHKNRKEASYKTTGKVIYDEYFPRHSKQIIDDIDHLIAPHYSLTEEEIDFVINYDIKYRLGFHNL
jgi:hypothetical protein